MRVVQQIRVPEDAVVGKAIWKGRRLANPKDPNSGMTAIVEVGTRVDPSKMDADTVERMLDRGVLEKGPDLEALELEAKPAPPTPKRRRK